MDLMRLQAGKQIQELQYRFMQLSKDSRFVSVLEVLENRVVCGLDTNYDKNIHSSFYLMDIFTISVGMVFWI